MRHTAGHAYYFLEDVYPRMSGRRPLKTPRLLSALFAAEDIIRPVAAPAPLQGAGFQAAAFAGARQCRLDIGLLALPAA